MSSAIAARLRKLELSKVLYEASNQYGPKEGLFYVLTENEISNPEALQWRIIRQFVCLPEDEKFEYADRIIKSQVPLPMFMEFNRIINNNYTKNQYLATFKGKREVQKRIYEYFELFLKYSKELNKKLNLAKQRIGCENKQKSGYYRLFRINYS